VAVEHLQRGLTLLEALLDTPEYRQLAQQLSVALSAPLAAIREGDNQEPFAEQQQQKTPGAA
jgi:hypothetical protein